MVIVVDGPSPDFADLTLADRPAGVTMALGGMALATMDGWTGADVAPAVFSFVETRAAVKAATLNG